MSETRVDQALAQAVENLLATSRDVQTHLDAACDLLVEYREIIKPLTERNPSSDMLVAIFCSALTMATVGVMASGGALWIDVAAFFVGSVSLPMSIMYGTFASVRMMHMRGGK